jgi:DNA transposition AAA+ family ATPase
MILVAGVTTLITRNGEVVPGLGTVTGRTGAGKSTTVAYLVRQHKAIFVRANAATTFSTLLASLCREAGLEASRLNHAKYEAIVALLIEQPRPIFIDEADYLIRDARMLEILRDIHDAARVPVILIGMERFETRLARHPQFARRISQKVEFGALDLEDTTLVAKELCEVEVAPDLIKKMHKATKGSIGHMVIALHHFEKFAKGFNWSKIDAAQWGDRAMFLGDKGA